MRKFTVQITVALFAMALVVSVAYAGGWQLNEHGARATGMGGAFVARASDLSAIYFNPAGLAWQKGTNILLGGTLIMPSTKFTGPSPLTLTTDMESQTFFPPNVYASYAANDKLTFGVGVFTPFGLGTKWPAGWPGRTLTTEADLQTFYVNPTVSFKINDQFAVGLGVSYVYGSVKLAQDIANPFAPGTYGSLTTDGATGSSFNFDLGLIYKISEKLSFGASYRSLTKLEFSGDVLFTGLPTAVFKNGPGKTTLPMPQNLQVGASYVLSPDFTVEGDFQWVGWSAYDQLVLELPAPLGKITLDKKWDDGFLFRVGGEYSMNPKFTLRAGFIYDIVGQGASKMEPMLPDADRTDITLGLSYKATDKISIDLAYMLVLFQDKTSTYRPTPTTSFGGNYSSSANLLGIDIGYSF